MEITLTTENII